MNTFNTFTPLPYSKEERKTQAPRVDHLNQSKKKKRTFPKDHFLLLMGIDLLLLNVSIFGNLAYAASSADPINGSFGQWALLFAAVNMLAVGIVSLKEFSFLFKGSALEPNFKYLLLAAGIYFGVFGFIYYQWFFPIFEADFLFPAFSTFLLLACIPHYAFNSLGLTKAKRVSYALIGGDQGSIKNVNNVFQTTFGGQNICEGRFGNDYLNGISNLGGYNEIQEYLNTDCAIDKLLYIDSDLSEKEIRQIAQLCRNKFISFEALPKEIKFFESGVQTKEVADLTLLTRKKGPLAEMANKVRKRVFDVVFSLLVIVLIFPWLFPLIALCIRLESPGPIFFKQKRSGKHGKPFTCLKFRSMRLNSQSDTKQAVRNDARITFIGAFLRKSSLDELPQFFNVLKGEMSVVGPRPHMLNHTERYSKLIDTFMIRHEIKPGITGWAQINGWRGPTPELYQMAKRVEYDVKYVENWSLWLDIKCIFMTAMQMFKIGNNAF